MNIIKIILLILLNTTFLLASNLNSVDFFQEGEVSKVVFQLDDDAYVERKHNKDTKQIIVDMKDVVAPDKVLRGFDVSEFSGSIVYVSGYQKNDNKNDLRVVVQLRDNVRSFIEKRNQKIILHVENRFGVLSEKKLKDAYKNNQSLTEDKELSSGDEKLLIPKSNSIEDILANLVQSGLKKYIGKKITINVSNVSYEEVLKMIADTSGFNIIIDSEVKKLEPLTIRLTNIPWDQALDTVLKLGSLVASKHTNILSITTEEKALIARTKELQAEQKQVVHEPMVTKIFPLSFAKQEDLIPVLSDYLTQARDDVKGGSIKADSRTNNLIVQDTMTNIERIKKIIEVLDTQTPQILIQSKIVEASESYEFRAGLATGINTRYNAFQDVSADTGFFSLSTAPNAQEASVLGASIDVLGRLNNLNFALDLMESEAKGRIVSSPKIITQDNQEAVITTTNQTSFRRVTTDATGGRTASFDSIAANISLTVTPKVTNEGSIDMKVAIQKDSFGTQPTSDSPPDRTSRTITTNVLVDNGSTIVIGGLYQSENSEVQSGIPVLKDLPLIGWLFKTAYNPKKTRSELIVFLTPRVINQEEAGLGQSSIAEDLEI